jgi:hypothetical protein
MRGAHAKGHPVILERLADRKHVTRAANSVLTQDDGAAGQEFRESSMTQTHESNVIAFDPRETCDWSKLIRKLRWIGWEEEARRLALAVSTLRPEERAGGSIGPFGTDQQ